MKNKAKENTTKKKVVIFGARGQLGTSFLKLFSEEVYEVIAISKTEVDITKIDNVKRSIEKHTPDIIINTAAYNKVEDAENNVETAYMVNAFGPYYLSLAAKNIEALFIHFSTDYVFDGDGGNFTEESVPSPINVYGASKLAGEHLTRIATDKHYIIRTSALFGRNSFNEDSNFVALMLSLIGKKPINVVSDQVTMLTFTDDLALKTIEIIEKGVPNGTYHITNTGIASWYEFAKEIFNIKKIDIKVNPIVTSQSGTTINRPKISTLLNKKLKEHNIDMMPEWQDALKRYLVNLK